jgi:hypothetical protein
VSHTEPPTYRKPTPPKKGRQARDLLLPLIRPASKQRSRSDMGQRLASALLGRKVDLRPDGRLWDRKTRSILVEDGDSWSMVDPETGEASEPMGPRRAINYSYLLAKASGNVNHVSGLMGQGEAPEWQGGTALFKPSLRLDPNWAETLRRRSRKEAKTRVKVMEDGLPVTEKVAMEKCYRHRLGWKLLTLTFPHPEGMRTMTQLRIFNGAFRRLTKMEIWEKVWGGVKGVEDKLTAHGAHVHGHLLLLMRYADRETLMGAWRMALDAEVKARHLPALQWGPRLKCVDIREVKENPAKRPDAVSWEIALDEVSKYITKTTDLLAPHPVTGAKVDAETLLELCDVKRWPRMFELLGKARSAAPAAKRALLDTSCISAAAFPISDVNGSQEALGQGVKWAFERFVGVTWTPGEPSGEVIPYIFDPEEGKPPPKRTRPDTWRELIDRVDVETWCRIIDERAKKAMAFRIRQLKGMLPRLFLQDLNGTVIVNQNMDVY